MDKTIAQAVTILTQGGIVTFPTDTAFAIGCRIDNRKAIERLFALRRRPKTQAAPVLVDTVGMAKRYVDKIPQEVIDKLIEPYWPGALTIILYCNKVKVTEPVRGGGDTLGIRIPNHPIARKIIQTVGVGILGPSANFHGGKTPYRFEDLDGELIKQVDFVVKGSCSLCMQSTVIDCSIKPWKVLRQGAIQIQL